MKLVIVLALAVATVSAFDLRGQVIEPRNAVKVPQGRISNGADAEVGQFPYQVGLSFSVSFLQSSWCGGSLISNEWVLTAAHCTENKKKAVVYLGATDRTAAEIKYKVYKDDFIIHPDYNSDKIENDISLIKIPSVKFSENIRPAKLPAIAKSYSSYTGDEVIASGWGLTSDEEEHSARNLQYGEMTIVRNSVCTRYFHTRIRSSNICVATPNSISACHGDSGGPLVLSSTGVQIGLTSFGSRAGCTLGHPVVFTRVTSYLEWIHQYLGDISTN